MRSPPKSKQLKLVGGAIAAHGIEDLLFEINNQLKSLENQAKKAEKYYEIKKEYRELSIELAKAALEGFNITNKELNGQSETETDKRIQLEAEIAKQEAELEEETVCRARRESCNPHGHNTLGRV